MPRPIRHPRALPAGHARNEEMRKVADELQQEGEERFAETGAIDPAKLQIEREAADLYQKTDGYEIDNPQPGYVYTWKRDEKPGEQVRPALAIRVPMPDGAWYPLWEVVQGDMPEFNTKNSPKGVIDVRGYRKIVDVILLRAKAERFRVYQQREERRRHQAEHGASQGLEQLARESHGQIRVVSEVEMTQQKTTLDRAMQQGFTRQQFSKKLREGTAHHI